MGEKIGQKVFVPVKAGVIIGTAGGEKGTGSKLGLLCHPNKRLGGTKKLYTCGLGPIEKGKSDSGTKIMWGRQNIAPEEGGFIKTTWGGEGSRFILAPSVMQGSLEGDEPERIK